LVEPSNRQWVLAIYSQFPIGEQVLFQVRELIFLMVWTKKPPNAASRIIVAGNIPGVILELDAH